MRRICADVRPVRRNFPVLVSLIFCWTVLLSALNAAGPAFAAPPVVTITSPPAGPTNDNTPFLEYAVDDPAATVTVKVNGDAVSKVSGESLDLSEGPYIIRVEAVNAALETGSAEVAITVDTVPPAQASFTAISSGKGHTMLLRADGTLWAVGENGYGQLGDGTVTNRGFPVRINAPNETDTRWTAVSAGWQHTLAIKDDGTLWAWGYNGNKQLGDGTTVTSRQTPYLIEGTAGRWTAVAAAYYHSLAVASDGSLWAWGDNTYGQLGDATKAGRNYMQRVRKAGGEYVAGIVSAAGGMHHSLALSDSGELYAWGRNNVGQVGDDGDAGDHTTAFSLGTGWTRIAAGGNHSLALDASGMLFAWGYNAFGQLGDNSTANRNAPAQIGNATWSRIAGGLCHTAAIDENGVLRAWGLNDQGQVGGAAGNPKTPVAVGSDSDWMEVAAGNYHTTALKSDGTYWAWGNNVYGVSGRTSPHPVTGGGSWNKIAAGYSHSAGIGTDGALRAWGYNNAGQLGDDTQVSKSSPAAAATGDPATWTELAAGAYFTLGVKTDGTLWAWGDNAQGQLGVPGSSKQLTPVPVVVTDAQGTPVQPQPVWSSVAAGVFHGAGLTATGELYTWGYNAQGQIGNGTTVNQGTPVQIPAGAGHTWISITAGTYFTLAIRDDDTLWAWGLNLSGQLGDGTATSRTSPVQVAAAGFPGGVESTWTQVACGSNHCLAIHTGGTLWSWGGNAYSQLGGGGARSSPEMIDGADDWAAVSAGQYYSFALKTTGELYGWGYNDQGQLGDGGTTTRTARTQIGTGSAWSAVSAKLTHTLAVRSDGTLWAWGYDAYGQLGDGVPVDRLSPRQVGPAISINNGAAFTNDASVTLDLRIADASCIAEVRFSGDGTDWSSAPEPWPSPGAFSATMGRQLPAGDGEKTVYVRFRDCAGNWSDAYSDAIVLDTAPPTAAVLAPVHGGKIKDDTPLIRFTASDGIVTVKVDGTVVSAGSGESLASPLSNGTHTVRVEAVDAAGNTGYAETAFIVDTTLPEYGTYISGDVTSDTMWPVEGSPYFITASIKVHGTATTPATLTIEPGVTVKFASGKGLQVGDGANQGALAAGDDLSSERVTLTRSGTSGTWSGLTFNDKTVDSATKLEKATIEYASGITMNSASPTIRNSTITGMTGSLTLVSSNAILSNVDITNAGNYGISLSNSSPVIAGGSLTNTNAAGQGIYGSGSPAISNYTITIVDTSGNYGLKLVGSASSLSVTHSTIANGLFIGETGILPTVTDNTFTHAYSSPIHAGANIIGQIMNSNTVDGMIPDGKIEVMSERISRDTRWRKWDAPYVILGTAVTVYKDTTSPATLTIDPGVKVKFNTDTRLQIGSGVNKGVLVARGTAGDNILFTSNQGSPAPGDWYGVNLDGAGSGASSLEYLTIEYAGRNGSSSSADLSISSSAPVIRNCTLRYSAGSGVYLINSDGWPVIIDSVITGNKWGVYSKASNPCITNTRIYANSASDYGVYNYSTTMDVDARNNWWGAAGGPTYAGNSNGTGDKINDHVLYNPWLGQEPGTSLAITEAKALPTSLNPEGDYIRFTAKISASADWTITLTDASEAVVKTFTGSGTAIDQLWHGEDGQDVKVANGVYYYRIDAVDANNNTATSPLGLLMVSRDLPIAIMELSQEMFTGGSPIDITGTLSKAAGASSMSYTLKYGVGENPVSWSQPLISSTTPVTNALIYTWDTSGLAGGVYTLRLTVTDSPSGNVATETARVRLLWIQNAAVSEPYISPNDDGVKDATTISATFTHPSNWTLAIKDGSLATVRTYAGSGPSMNQAWDGKNEAGDVFDGAYTYQIDAVSSETGTSALFVTGNVAVDTTIPLAQITAPAGNAVLRDSVDVVGTADDANFVTYSVEYGPGSGNGPWTQISSATTAVPSGVLANWITNDATNTVLIPNGGYLLRLAVSDRAGNIGTATVPVSMENLILSGVDVTSHTLDTYAAQTSAVSYDINSPATVTLKIIPERQGPTGVPSYQAVQTMAGAGASSFTWDGRDNAGVPVPDEAYLYILEATDGTRSDSYSPPAPTGSGTITCSPSTGFDYAKNLPMTITYTPAQPSRITVGIRWWYSNFNILDSFPATAESSTVDWNGISAGNTLLDTFAYFTCSVASLLPENYLITSGDTVAVSGLETDPYAMNFAFGQFTRIKYSLSREAYVTVTITSPSGATITLVNNELQPAEPQTLPWDGRDVSDTTGKKMLIAEEGAYIVSVQAVNPATGSISPPVKANLRVGY